MAYLRNLRRFSILLISRCMLFLIITILLMIDDKVFSIENFDVLDHNKVIDQNGFIRLFGQIRNISNDSQRMIAAHANFYDQNGNSIGNASGIVPLRSLNPGDMSPFQIVFLDKNQTNNFQNYTLDFTSKAGEYKPEKLIVQSLNSRQDIFGYYYINGRIFNMGNDTATNTHAISSFFDHQGKMIGLSSAIAEPSNMTSQSASSFTVVMDDKLQSTRIKNYSLIVDSDQYVSR